MARRIRAGAALRTKRAIREIIATEAARGDGNAQAWLAARESRALLLFERRP